MTSNIGNVGTNPYYNFVMATHHLRIISDRSRPLLPSAERRVGAPPSRAARLYLVLTMLGQCSVFELRKGRGGNDCTKKVLQADNPDPSVPTPGCEWLGLGSP